MLHIKSLSPSVKTPFFFESFARFQKSQLTFNQSRKRLVSLGLALTALFLLSVTNSHAQTWHKVYGPDNGIESGYSRVTPVKFNCSGGGYIAVGTSYSNDPNGDIYVVRTNDVGTTIWEYQYDVFGLNLEDVGRSIAEQSDGSGFVITGWSVTPRGDVDVVALKINCNGQVSWTRTFGSLTCDEYGYDIIETITGDPFTGYPQDLIIAGGAYDCQASNMDGYLVRITKNGILLWDRAYDHLGHQDQIFYGVTEARGSLQNPLTVGDIIAVGYHDDAASSSKQGYVARVSGADGLIYAAPQGVAHYGSCMTNCGDEIFYSVLEQLNPTENDDPEGDPYEGNQDVVIAGYSDSPGNKEIYVVKLNGGNPCVLERDIIIGDGIGVAGKKDDVAHMIYEQPSNVTSSNLNQFDLLVTGYTGVAMIPADDDIILQSLNPTTLAPIPAISMQYGSVGVERGWSVHDVVSNGGTRTNGFILCGYNQSDPYSKGDPQDLFLIKTDENGNSGTLTCERSYDPVDNDYTDFFFCLSPLTRQPDEFTTAITARTSYDTDLEACTQDADPEKRVLPGPGGTLMEDIDFSSVVVPNVTNAGRAVHVKVESAEPAPLTLILSDALGKVVSRQDVVAESGDTEYEFSTMDLPKGIYFVGVHRGEDSWLERVLIQ